MSWHSIFDFVYQDSYSAKNETYLLSGVKVLMMFFTSHTRFILLLLRFSQYYASKQCVSRAAKYLYKLVSRRYYKLCDLYNVELPIEVNLGRGCCFPHKFPLVINPQAVIGINCVIHPCVLIGRHRGKDGAPVIGDNCFIGHGAKIIGNPIIGDFCFITPGAVVTKNVPACSVVGAGVNNILSNKGKELILLYQPSK